MQENNRQPLRAYDYLGHHREGDTIVFRLYAPHADSVALVGDFNGWSDSADPFLRTERGIWEARIAAERAQPDCKYKFEVSKDGVPHLISDPFSFFLEDSPLAASVLWDSRYKWRDDGYVTARRRYTDRCRPLNIYELYPPTWRADCTTYREIGEALIPYVKKMGFTHVLFTRADDAFYYAPPAHPGSPDDFKFLVDELHRAGIGVILDRLPGELPKENPKAYALSDALFWIEEYHADGLVIPDSYPDIGLSEAVRTLHPYIITIGKEDHCRSNQWEKQISSYLSTASAIRGTVPEPSERHPRILPVRGGDVTLIDRICADYENKFATLRAFYTYLMSAPGGKLLFMGNEFGQFKAWNGTDCPEWFMTDFEHHDCLQHFISRLNHFYLANPALWDNDNSICLARESGIIAFRRTDRAGNELIVCINLSEKEDTSYPIPAPKGEYQTVFSSEADDKIYTSEDTSIHIALKPLSAVIIKPITRKERHNV